MYAASIASSRCSSRNTLSLASASIGEVVPSLSMCDPRELYRQPPRELKERVSGLRRRTRCYRSPMNKQEIRALLEGRIRAWRDEDLDAIMAGYARDIVHVSPFGHRVGVEAMR